jgi:ABC-type uncharacterized transport system involved in gliding motility auxiliary subunit
MNLLKSISKTTWLLAAALLSAISIPVVKILFPEQVAPLAIAAVIFTAILGALIYDNRNSLKGRTAAFGLNSVITSLLVISIVAVANFFAFRLQWKADLTRTKKHGLAEQTQKLIRELQAPVQATLYASQARGGESRELLEKLKGLGTQLTVEFVEPALEPMRAR